MFNPFIDNLKDLSDSELEQKILELSKKFFMAQRLGKIDLLTQVQTALIMYREETVRRATSKQSQLDNDLDQLINVD